ncbi:MAG: hypothetical protein LC792_19855, partial [Actinobacteria bacterium]|nr:hypothetical protein [Actinomycetota bacterium]
MAQGEARLLGDDHVGSEHLLLGLLHEGQGLAARVLGRLGLDLGHARGRVKETVGTGETTPPDGTLPL